jgi:hypothetical protein
VNKHSSLFVLDEQEKVLNIAATVAAEIKEKKKMN